MTPSVKWHVKALALDRQFLILDMSAGVIYIKKGGDNMPTNQKYSTRIHSKRQLTRANEHIQSAAKVLFEIKPRYAAALPRVSLACEQMIAMLSMVENMIDDIRSNI